MKIWKYVNYKLNEEQVGSIRSRFVSKLIPNITKSCAVNSQTTYKFVYVNTFG